jgi:hypothetical protein
MDLDHERSHTADTDPIRRSRREAHSFNRAWLKNGERLTLVQRTGFAILSLFMLLAGLFAVFNAAADMLDVETSALGVVWDACLGLIFALVFLLPGVLGLRNVLRFPKYPSAAD